jgi:hypothetical protein
MLNDMFARVCLAVWNKHLPSDLKVVIQAQAI